jgi:hypothetical protein
MQDEVIKQQALRLAFLRRLYQVSGGSTRGGIAMEEIGNELRLDRRGTARVVEYLRAEGLADWFGAGGLVGITHAGVVEVEAAIENPERSTEHFQSGAIIIAKTYIHADSINNSQIQIDSPNSHQTITTFDVDELRAVIAELRKLVRGAELAEDAAAAVYADLATADAQLGSPHPRIAVVREVLKSVQHTLEGAAGAVLAPELADQLHRLGQLLAQLPH